MPTLVHFRSVPATAISFLQTLLSPKAPLPTACLHISKVAGFLLNHRLRNMPRKLKNPPSHREDSILTIYKLNSSEVKSDIIKLNYSYKVKILEILCTEIHLYILKCKPWYKIYSQQAIYLKNIIHYKFL
ncbi:hypothetical protein EDD79_1001199 [Serpentinicella alkaliphila]|uniref:Uncharacterized protein n=1 Tax=Serpentinicella alkaliphila TaxID=1734049 RepID=A0A4R2TVT5_9FIRM|nr:hypothetical protein EDD79_1001199 [Serpentinicella alkaliphila]